MRLTLKSFPKEWDQEERMKHLYGSFRKRELNPVGYDSKMTFWKNLIDSTLNECGCCTFTLEELQNTFVRNGRKPDSLQEVIDSLLSENEINYVSDFEALVPSEDTWTSWAVKSLVSTPLKWSFSKLKDSLLSPPQTDYDRKFVHLSVVKRKANDLLSNVNEDLRDIMLTMDQLKDIGRHCCINEDDLEIVVHSLELQGLAAVTILDNKKLVKFAHTGKKIEQISEADKAVFSLKQNEKQLTNSVENLETQKQEMVQEAKNYLKKGMRPMAKSCLRKKKELEKQIDKHVAALDNIQILLARIHDTESNSKVFESYKISLSALKNQFKEAGLTEDSVSNTMAQVQEVLDIHDDIQTMLGEPASNTVTSDEDYETELEELIRNKEPEKTEFDHFDLPEPPSVSPISNKTTSKDYKKVQQLA